VLTGSAGVAGTVTFTTQGASTHVTGEITGLAPGFHGFHVHQVRPAVGLGSGSAARPSFRGRPAQACGIPCELLGHVLTLRVVAAAG
jgi:Cu/Zn superoxide dismutase